MLTIARLSERKTPRARRLPMGMFSETGHLSKQKGSRHRVRHAFSEQKGSRRQVRHTFSEQKSSRHQVRRTFSEQKSSRHQVRRNFFEQYSAASRARRMQPQKVSSRVPVGDAGRRGSTSAQPFVSSDRFAFTPWNHRPPSQPPPPPLWGTRLLEPRRVRPRSFAICFGC